MDAFFAAVEQLDHPEWRGLPVIVGGSAEGRGVVSTASYEARRFGVHSAMPSAQARRLCPDAIWAPPNFARYRELSARICGIFRDVTPSVQQVSIDEAYLDVTPSEHNPGDPPASARRIQDLVDALGLTCSIGVATSKTVAKIASDHKKPHGITVVRPGEERVFLAPLPVTALPGVGAATAGQLRSAGIRTLGQLAILDPVSGVQLLGSSAASLIARAGGVDDRPVREEDVTKSVSNEWTFARDVRDATELAASLRTLVDKVAARLRRSGLKARTLTLKLRDADFSTHTASRTVALPVDDAPELLTVATALLRQTWRAGTPVRLLGFGVSGFEERIEQLDLFADDAGPARKRSRALAESLDAVKARFGDGAIGFGHAERDDPDE